jgi:hypothetical protein
MGIFLTFLSAMSACFSDVLIHKGALATARSSLASPTGSERVVC